MVSVRVVVFVELLGVTELKEALEKPPDHHDATQQQLGAAEHADCEQQRVVARERLVRLV